MTAFHLPTDGSVLVVDDKIEEARPLMEMLSSKGIPYTYYTGDDPDKLPETPIQKIRLAFFDIQLVTARTSHEYAQIILGLLESIIPEKNGPYVMVLWSRRLELHADEVVRQVSAKTNSKKPLDIILLDKSDYFSAVDEPSYEDKITDLSAHLQTLLPDDLLENVVTAVRGAIPPYGQWQARSDTALSDILRRLQDELQDKVNCFQLFTLWETQINKAAGNTVAAYSDLHSDTAHWDANIRYTIYRMAHAQAGQSADKLDDKGLMENALRTLNQTFLDDIETCISSAGHFSENITIDKDNIFFTVTIKNVIYRLRLKASTGNYHFYKGAELIPPGYPGTHDLDKLKAQVVKQFNRGGGDPDGIKAIDKVIKLYDAVKPEINSRLHIDNTAIDYLKPGNLYEFKGISSDRRKALLKSYFKEGDKQTNLYSQNRFRKNIRSLEKIRFVELEVTPPCDYAQNKWLKSRVLPGLLIPENFLEFSLDTGEYSYELPTIKYENENYKLLFDFRLFKSVDHSHMESMKDDILFRVRQEVHADIISKLSNHVNRLGIAELI